MIFLSKGSREVVFVKRKLVPIKLTIRKGWEVFVISLVWDELDINISMFYYTFIEWDC